MNMVEKVARAICITSGIEPDTMITCLMPAFINPSRFGVYGAHLKLPDDAFRPGWEYYIPHARAAIEAMREPSEEMNFASNQIVDVADSGKDIWEAMIDAALKE